VFIMHPGTKRGAALYASRLMTARIKDMDETESSDILEELYSYAEDLASITNVSGSAAILSDGTTCAQPTRGLTFRQVSAGCCCVVSWKAITDRPW